MAGKTAFAEKQILNRWYRKLSTTAIAGSSGTSLNITSTTGFAVGDLILLASSSPANFIAQITAIVDADTVTLAYAPTTTPTSGAVTAIGWSPVAVYVALFTAVPSDAGGGTEATGGNYARQAIAIADGSWNAPSSTPSAMTNIATPTWTSVTWTGTVVAWAFMDALTAGNMIAWYDCADQVVASGNTVTFNAGAISVSED